jgi:hypothetical protein
VQEALRKGFAGTKPADVVPIVSAASLGFLALLVRSVQEQAEQTFSAPQPDPVQPEPSPLEGVLFMVYCFAHWHADPRR